MTIGERIKDLRKKQGLTQQELGEILGVEKSTISMYENNKTRPDDFIKLKLADYFDVSIDYLLCRTDVTTPYIEMKDFPEGLRILRRAKNELTPEARERMLEISNLFIDSLTNKETKDN